MSGEDREAAEWEGFGADEIARRWSVPELHLFDAVGSTNDVARGLAENGAPSGTVVLADEQLAGRGRSGRHWVSPPHLGLWISLVLRPAGMDNLEIAPLLVGLATARALENESGAANVSIKWPNDLLANGRKLGGILCEGVWNAKGPAFLIVGIGLNILQREADFPEEIRHRATSLSIAAGYPPAREPVGGAIVSNVLALAADPPKDLSALGPELDRRDALRDREVVITEPTSGDPRAHGTALGIAPDGSLVLRRSDGNLEHIRSGTVRLATEQASFRQLNRDQREWIWSST
ncbi:MAG TPA: biotin--[acetyl-CoA-carboxylase] ligase [Longimicrobiaceae bacterium]|nr:biotin--[acetyl-CoA-carboxylase] ligase [Longimicrobiaceae bacterium]